jgi:hypothetical protein
MAEFHLSDWFSQHQGLIPYVDTVRVPGETSRRVPFATKRAAIQNRMLSQLANLVSFLTNEHAAITERLDRVASKPLPPCSSQ